MPVVCALADAISERLPADATSVRLHADATRARVCFARPRQVMAALKAKMPSITAISFDLPEVIAAAGEANAKLGGVASEAPQAAERFRELASELRELTVMTPDALADLYDADHERTVAVLKVQKDLLVEECKAALAKNV